MKVKLVFHKKRFFCCRGFFRGFPAGKAPLNQGFFAMPAGGQSGKICLLRAEGFLKQKAAGADQIPRFFIPLLKDKYLCQKASGKKTGRLAPGSRQFKAIRFFSRAKRRLPAFCRVSPRGGRLYRRLLSQHTVFFYWMSVFVYIKASSKQASPARQLLTVRGGGAHWDSQPPQLKGS